MADYPIVERPAWRRWVTPQLLKSKPLHRWFVFPHSFTSELVHALIDEWGLDSNDLILDPFVGAGTTLLAAKERGIPAQGYDLSPLAVLASQVKIANYRLARLRAAWGQLQATLDPQAWQIPMRSYAPLVEQALPGRLLAAFDAIAQQIDQLHCSKAERSFFRLAMLRLIPIYSRAVATGGWLSWRDTPRRITSLPGAFSDQVEAMLADLQPTPLSRQAHWHAAYADARQLPDENDSYSAVITSPPYPNRHDYTRVFGVELLFGFLNWEETRQLRYQSFCSHPEARPERPQAESYQTPLRLDTLIAQLEEVQADPRIAPMLQGYFLDMYLCLREAARVTRPRGHIAFVVGNAQYTGTPIPVDELVAEIGEQVGLTCTAITAVRYRGNSAQQMRRYGRQLSRESVVLLTKPS